jgi:hypothetical protein
MTHEAQVSSRFRFTALESVSSTGRKDRQRAAGHFRPMARLNPP